MGLMDRLRRPRDSDAWDSRADADPQAPRNTTTSASFEDAADRRGYSLSPQFNSTPQMSYSPFERDSIGSSSDRRRSITSSYIGTEYTFGPTQSAHSNFPRAEAAPPDLFPSQGRLCIAVDLGTVLSGVAYGRSTAGSVRPILWPGPSRKIPTSLVYDPMGVLRACGFNAKNWQLADGWTRCEMFKLYFDPQARDLLPPLPPHKELIHLVTDYLRWLWGGAKQAILRDHYTPEDIKSADIWISIPAIWSPASGELMRDAAFNAGLVEHQDSTHYSGGRDRLHIIAEPEAAAVHSALWNNPHLRPNHVFMVCDAGGGTIDTAIYTFLGSLHEIAELCASSGSSCGSHFLDLAFRNYLENWHHGRNIHLSEANLSHYMHSFTYTQKLAYSGEEEDADNFFFECYDPSLYLPPYYVPPLSEFTHGQLVVRGDVFRMQIFDPVVARVLDIIESQLSRANTTVHALLLVGGFAVNPYLYHRIHRRFRPRIQHILSPRDADIATCLGAAQSGIERGLVRRALTSPTIIAAKSYIISAELPATAEDKSRQGAFIRRNRLRVEVCESRTRYLVTKGAVLKKGEPVRKYCRMSCGGPLDYTFFAHFYSSDRAEREPYVNGGDLVFLKTWKIELKDIPSFRSYIQHPRQEGLEIDFELGIEIDSASVRAVWFYEGRRKGATVLESFT